MQTEIGDTHKKYPSQNNDYVNNPETEAIPDNAQDHQKKIEVSQRRSSKLH